MKYKLIESASGKEIKPGMNLVSFNNQMYKFKDFKSPKHGGSTGRVNVTHCDTGVEREFYPSVFGLEIVEAPRDPFDN